LPGERITPLDLIVGNFGDVSRGQVSADLEHSENNDLFLAMGLIARIGYALHRLYGETDPRTVRVNSAMGPIGREMNRRGLNPMKINLETSFQGWCAHVSEGAPSASTLSTSALSMLRVLVRETLANFAGSRMPPEFRDAFLMIDTAVSSSLAARGVVADAPNIGGLQA